MKFTAMKHRVLAAHAHCTPAGTVIRVQGGLPPEGPAPAPGEPVDAPPKRLRRRQSYPEASGGHGGMPKPKWAAPSFDNPPNAESSLFDVKRFLRCILRDVGRLHGRRSRPDSRRRLVAAAGQLAGIFEW
jgi:hypothetical protein